MFITQADYEIYESMDASSVDVKFLWSRLSPCIAHLDVYDRRSVYSALIAAYYAHDGQLRKSGEPFITHPLEVARILGSMDLDGDTIVAGLLHDTVEDTDRVTFEEIHRRFGDHVARIVEAETRLTKMKPTKPGESVKEVDFRHFFRWISQDVRIVLVKLADRLHNMRTMESMKSEKQIEKASETLQIYAPLAAVLGLDSMKEEMEELSLRYVDPMRYKELKDHLEELQKEQGAALEEARETLEKTLRDDSILSQAVNRITVSCKQRSIYHLYKLYRKAGWNLDGAKELRRAMQLHVMLETPLSAPEDVKLCYCALGAVHLLWSSIPGKIRDSITTPKPAPWKGLVTTVCPHLTARLVTPVEVLIQTSQMSLFVLEDWPPSELNACMQARGLMPNGTDSGDEGEDTSGSSDSLDSVDDNEFRAAIGEKISLNGSRTASKTVSNRVNGTKPAKPVEAPVVINGGGGGQSQGKLWFSRFKAWEDEIGMNMSASEYAACVRDDFLSPSVYVFTHDGQVVSLPKGATVLDFAYHIHAHIGNRAVGAKVDGCRVGPSYTLQNAQVVEIMSHDWKISREYLEILRSRIPAVQTTSARRKLKQYLTQISKELGQDQVAFREERSSLAHTESHLWIDVTCRDEKGVLAELTSVVAAQGLNITRHRCQKLPGGNFLIKYGVHDPGGKHAEELSEALEKVKGCENVCVGCSVPSLIASPMGWYLPSQSSKS